MIPACGASPAAPRRATSPACDHKGRWRPWRQRHHEAAWARNAPAWPGRDKGRVLVRSSGSGQYRRRTAGARWLGPGERRRRRRATRPPGQTRHGLRGARPGLLDGGSLAASARRRPSPVHCGINASPAPAIRHSPATACPLASSCGPLRSAEPSASPATSASRPGRSPATSRSSAAPAAFSSSSRAPQRA